MSAPRLDAPHDQLFAAAEEMVLAGFEQLSQGAACTAFERWPTWLDAADAELPLRRVALGFGLDSAECSFLSLLFVAQLSERVARQIAAVSSGGGRGVPVWVAQQLIPELRAESLAAAGVLRHFGLVGVEADALRVEAHTWLREAVLDRFCGARVRESDVAARMAPLSPNPALASELLASQLQSALADRGADRLSPVILGGRVEPAVVGGTLAAIGLAPYMLAASMIPDEPGARDHLARMWSRDAALDAAALIITADGRDAVGLADFVDRIAGHIVITGSLPPTEFRRSIRMIGDSTVASAGTADRWRRALGAPRAKKLDGGVARVAAHFKLSAAEIDDVCARVGREIDAAPTKEDAAAILWHAAGRVSVTAPVPGVWVVEPAYRWQDIVLAPPIEAALRRVEGHVRHAVTVMDEWGFAERMGGRGRGVAALFSGPSGTGKTMAAEVLASSLDLRMMVIDLSQIISKFVGETSKNIAAAFSQAERSGAVMVWNEGDAIWGARGSVGNATDRHVNAEIGDLLQRIEEFRGFTVVTTNMRQAIDPAFLRRFRFAIDFPMPSESERLKLWQLAFPKNAPIDAIDWRPLAALPLSGGSIRNVALGSAFLAAEGGSRIDSRLISAELAEELRKNNQPMPAIDWGTRQ